MSAAHVTAIRRRRPGDAAVDVVLDSGETVRVHDRRVVEHRLGAGMALGAAGLDALRRAAAFDAAEVRALRLIARRPRSTAELRTRMAGWGVDEVTAAGVVERLRELGQIDDRRLAMAVAESGRARGYGRFRTAGDLGAAGGRRTGGRCGARRAPRRRAARRRTGRPRPVRAAAVRRPHGPAGGRIPGAARFRPRRRRSGGRPADLRLTDPVAAADGARLPSPVSPASPPSSFFLPLDSGFTCTGTRLRSARAQPSPHAEAARASARPGGRRRPGRQTDLIDAADRRHVHKETRWSRC